MDNKNLGLIVIGLSVVFSLLIFGFNNQLTQLQVDTCSCENTCDAIHEPSFLVHAGIAFIFATLSLGIYLLFFERSHKVLVAKLKEDSFIKSEEERFSLVLMGLSEDEKKVLTAVKDQDGISQHTLGLRTNLHKSKLSITTGMLEEKGLIKKEKKGKTNQLFLRMNLSHNQKQK